jgi:hypothetical protein
MIPLYYLSSFAGLTMVVGGIWLLYKQKIYIVRESNQVTEIETPVGKFKTNVPALALFVLGFFPLIYPIVISKQFVEEVRIHGNVKANIPLAVYVVSKEGSPSRDGDFRLQVPFLRKGDESYKILFSLANGQVIVGDWVDMKKAKGGEILLPAQVIEVPSATSVHYKPHVQPIPPEFK